LYFYGLDFNLYINTVAVVDKSPNCKTVQDYARARLILDFIISFIELAAVLSLENKNYKATFFNENFNFLLLLVALKKIGDFGGYIIWL
jgi:hypothetical protein